MTPEELKAKLSDAVQGTDFTVASPEELKEILKAANTAPEPPLSSNSVMPNTEPPLPDDGTQPEPPTEPISISSDDALDNHIFVRDFGRSIGRGLIYAERELALGHITEEDFAILRRRAQRQRDQNFITDFPPEFVGPVPELRPQNFGGSDKG